MTLYRQFISSCRTVHVYLSILLLLVLVFFSVTGITLNNASLMSGEPRVSDTYIEAIPNLPRDDNNQIIYSSDLADYLRQISNVRLSLATLAYEDEFLVIDYQSPGHATLIEIDQELAEAYIEQTDFGFIAFINDLHKGRHVSVILSWVIDISGVLVIIFSIAGLMLLLPNKRRFKKVSLYSLVAFVCLWIGYYLI